jgi:hypothetical protein
MGIWCLGRSAKGTGQRKERESNPQGLSARPLSRRLPSPSWLVFPCQSARQDLNLRSSASDADDHSRLVHSLLQSGRRDLNPRSPAPQAGGLPGFPTPCAKSTQRESNPHVHHGKVAGCRYITGAWLGYQVVKEPFGQYWRRESNPRFPD